MKILACAVGFGLGPGGKLCSIVNYNKKYEWYACGDRLDLSIYKENPFIDTCWSKNEGILKNFIKKNDIKYAVDVLDPDLAILLKNIGVKVIYVDSLPFMWNQADIIPYNVEFYCAQKYPGYTENPALKPVKNFVWVEPITPGEAMNKIKSGIVINFGGLHSPFGNGKEYFEVVMKSLFPILQNKNIYITGGQNAINLTKELYPQFLCATYPHQDFLDLVSSSELFITSPGLTTIYETCGMNIKTIVLPPQNLSQFYNISIAEKIYKNVKIINWNYKNLDPKHLECFKNKPEEEAVKYIYEQINLLSKNEQDIEKFREYVFNKLKDDFKENTTEKHANNGVKEVSKILFEMIKDK